MGLYIHTDDGWYAVTAKINVIKFPGFLKIEESHVMLKSIKRNYIKHKSTILKNKGIAKMRLFIKRMESEDTSTLECYNRNYIYILNPSKYSYNEWILEIYENLKATLRHFNALDNMFINRYNKIKETIK